MTEPSIAKISGRLWRVETRRGSELASADRKLALGIELALIIAISAIAFWYGASTYIEKSESASFYQSNFAPAVSLACTGTLDRFEPTRSVQQFLNLKRPDLPSCDEVAGAPKLPFTTFDRGAVYLYVLAALSWLVFGFQWSSLFFVAGLLTAGFALASHGLFRVLFPSRLVCAGLALAVIVATPASFFIPQLRDYSKAAFIVGAIAILATEVAHPGRNLMRHGLAGLSVGVLVGIGFGFRNDMSVLFPMVVLLPLLLLAAMPLARFVRVAPTIWGGFLAGYVVLSALLRLLVPLPPIAGSFIGHVFILGFADRSFSDLGMNDAPYSLISPYIDRYVQGIATLFSGADAAPIEWGTKRYDEVNNDLLVAAVLQTPNDALLRLFYSANKVGDITVFNRLSWNWLGAVALLAVSLIRGRYVLLIAIPYIILVSAMTIQFNIRHAFYLGIFGPAFLLIVVEAAFSTGRSWLRGDGMPSVKPPAAWLLLGCILFSTVAIAVASSWSSIKQARALDSTLNKYRDLRWMTIDHKQIGQVLSPTGSVALQNGTQLALDADAWQKPHITDGSVSAAFSRVRFKVGASTGMEKAIRIVDWRAVQGDLMEKAGQGFSLETARRGYVAASAPISGRALLDQLSTGTGRQIILRASGETKSGVFAVGVLNKTKNKFVLSERVPLGKWTVESALEIEVDSDIFSVIFSNVEGSQGRFGIDSLSFVDTDVSDCYAHKATIKPYYSYLGKNRFLPKKQLEISPGEFTYFFPVMYAPELYFVGVELSGLDPSCLIDWSIAENFPAGQAPVEMLVGEAGLARDHRGSWGDIWRDFLR